LDLTDKLAAPGVAAGGGAAAAAPDALDEARQALLAMGFSAAEVATAVKGYDGAPTDAQALLRHALRRLGGGS
ncbi:MAG: Holliday junction branch migration protein RuvA, partial [Actinobacteria bacterium]